MIDFMKKKNNTVIQESRPLDPRVEEILNQDDDDFFDGFDDGESFELSFESAMEP